MIGFLDIDEVLADFVGAACEVHGVSRQEVNRYRQEWAIEKPISFVKYGRSDLLTAEGLWEPIESRGESFWKELNAFPWMDDLIRLVENECDEWYLVTSPARSLHAYGGKIAWIRKHFGDRFNRVFLCHHKDLLAGPDRVLIDDRLENVARFRQAGGKAVLFPTAVEYQGTRYVGPSGDPIDPVGFVAFALAVLKGATYADC